MTQPEQTAPLQANDANAGGDSLAEKIARIAESLRHLASGDLAMLRRAPLRRGEAGAPAFWLLSARHDFPAEPRWAAIIQAMALLTRRSSEGRTHHSPHDPAVPLGRALCDGNDPAWPGAGEARPALSELRFARLLNSHGEKRQELLLRAVRMLARAERPVNCVDIAAFLLAAPGHEGPARRLARDYYGRLAFARRQTGEEASGA